MDPEPERSADGAARVEAERRDRSVSRFLLLEGAANLLVLAAKLVVGLSTGSLAVLSDAVHSFTDVANNAVALGVMRLARKPPDRGHPYGHRKFETLAVLGLGVLLVVTAIEIVQRAVGAAEREVTAAPWELAVMLGVLGANVAIAAVERRAARRLGSDILLADATHTAGDVLTTVVVLVGWQLSAAGYRWLDSVLAVGVALLVLRLAWGLFRRAVPVLVDGTAVAPEALEDTVASVRGVRDVPRVRSRSTGASRAVDVVVTVAPELTTVEGHAIADAVEGLLRERFDAEDVTVHVEPDVRPSGEASPPARR